MHYIIEWASVSFCAHVIHSALAEGDKLNIGKC